MKVTIVENMKLLDGMHEGLLILAQDTKQVMFCNKTAQKLLIRAISYFNE